MRPMLLCLCLLFLAVPATSALADEPQAATAAVAPAPSLVTMRAEDLAALVRAAQPASVAAPVVAPAVVSETGVFGLGWGTIGGGLMALFALVGAVWKSRTWSRVQKAVPDLIDASYWFVERNFSDLPGPQKALVAMGSLYQGLTGHGLLLDPKLEARAATRWQLLAEQNKTPAAPAPAALAGAQAAAQVATSQGTATDLADRAAR